MRAVTTNTFVLSFRRSPLHGLPIRNVYAAAGEIFAEQRETNPKDTCIKRQFNIIEHSRPYALHRFLRPPRKCLPGKMKLRRPAK